MTHVAVSERHGDRRRVQFRVDLRRDAREGFRREGSQPLGCAVRIQHRSGAGPLIRWWVGPSKLVEVIAPALAECLQAAAPHRPDDIPVLLGVPSPDRAHRWSGFDERILAEVQERLGTRFHPDSRVLPRGNVSGVAGLRQARTWIAKGVVECCIVAGVDSYLEQPVVDAYAAKRRVLTPVNSNGFIPGEAGTAILVTRTERPERDGLEILGIGLAKEKRHHRLRAALPEPRD